ncbi:MAG: TIGR03435 family protein [Acidobacteriia bacterium]|nr:TIGR03435 family protein [Terriglobia bacterium]MBV8904238.1 TIGR03435 family protein [Terriglobia bacterium]
MRDVATIVLAVAINIAIVMPSPAPAQVSAQPTSKVIPEFDVAAVKPCKDDVPLDTRTGGAAISSPETLDIECNTLKGLIHMAYVAFGSGVRVTPDPVKIEGGPKWINSERYTIKAKAAGVKSQMMMHGPMLQLLLEDRFKVTVHHETREVPVYVLSVAKGGPKLQAFSEGTCNPYDPAAAFPPPPPPANACHNRGGMNNGVLTLDIPATTLDDFARFSLGVMDRPVLNKTGITGRFNFHLEYTPDETSSAGRVSDVGAQVSGPSIFGAVEQLGLKLTAAKGPGDYLVVDHAERPTEN